MRKNCYLPASKLDSKKAFLLESLLFGKTGAKHFSEDEFLTWSQGQGVPTGKLVCETDGGYPLILNDYSEINFLKLITSSGYASSVRGQCKEIPYRKPWAYTPGPYYPDFLFRTYDGRIAIVEIKSILGMCQDENIAKFNGLMAYGLAHGMMVGFLDAELVSFNDYLEPLTAPLEIAVAAFFRRTIAAVGGFTQNDLQRLYKLFPGKKESTLKRIVASLVLQDPTLQNRYCHDSPFLLNAVKLPSPLDYKRF